MNSTSLEIEAIVIFNLDDLKDQDTQSALLKKMNELPITEKKKLPDHV